jgi:hypothetical protein
MPVHKFIHKYPQPNANTQFIHKYPSVPPVAVLWYPAEDVKYPAERDHTLKWKIFAQEDIIVQSHNVASIELRFGVELSNWCDYCLVDATVEEGQIEYSE